MSSGVEVGVSEIFSPKEANHSGLSRRRLVGLDVAISSVFTGGAENERSLEQKILESHHAALASRWQHRFKPTTVRERPDTLLGGRGGTRIVYVKVKWQLRTRGNYCSS